MTTKNRDSLKGVLKDVEQERRKESEAASKLKVDNRKAFKDLEDKGFNRIIIVPKTIEKEIEFVNAPEIVIPIPKEKIVKTKKILEENAEAARLEMIKIEEAKAFELKKQAEEKAKEVKIAKLKEDLKELETE